MRIVSSAINELIGHLLHEHAGEGSLHLVGLHGGGDHEGDAAEERKLLGHELVDVQAVAEEPGTQHAADQKVGVDLREKCPPSAT